MNFKNYQIINWNKWIGIKRLPPYPDIKGEFRGGVYDMRLCLGFIEIRRFKQRTE